MVEQSQWTRVSQKVEDLLCLEVREERQLARSDILNDYAWMKEADKLYSIQN